MMCERHHVCVRPFMWARCKASQMCKAFHVCKHVLQHHSTFLATLTLTPRPLQCLVAVLILRPQPIYVLTEPMHVLTVVSCITGPGTSTAEMLAIPLVAWRTMCMLGEALLGEALLGEAPIVEQTVVKLSVRGLLRPEASCWISRRGSTTALLMTTTKRRLPMLLLGSFSMNVSLTKHQLPP
jgi:hypothetical protein